MRRHGWWLGAIALSVVACSSEKFEASDGSGGAAGAAGQVGTAGAAGQAGQAGAAGAGAGDAGSDAEAYVPILETVTVDNGEGYSIPDADVFSSAPDGSLFATTKTDATGTAVIDVPPGGSVSSILTRVDPGSTGTALKLHLLYTQVDVKQGSTVRLLSFQEGPPAPEAPKMGDITLNFANVPAGTQNVYVQTPCTSTTHAGTAPLVLSNYRACTKESTYDVFALALDDKDAVLGSAFVLEKPFKAGATASHTLSFTTNLVSTTAGMDALPAGTDTASLSVFAWRAQRPSMTLRRQRDFSDFTTGSVAATFSLPSDLPLSFAIHERVSWKDGERGYGAERVTPLATLPSSSTWSLPPALARVDGLGAPDLKDIARPKFEWQLTDGNLGPCALLTTQAQHSESEFMMWTAVMTAQKDGNFQLPELPEDYADATLALGDVVSSVEVFHVDTPSAKVLDQCPEAVSVARVDQPLVITSASWGSPLK